MTELARTARLDVLLEGYGRTPHVAGMVADRGLVLGALAERGVRPEDVIDVVLSHHTSTARSTWRCSRSCRCTTSSRSCTVTSSPGARPTGCSSPRASACSRRRGTRRRTLTTLVGTADGVVALTHLWWTGEGPADDPYAADRELPGCAGCDAALRPRCRAPHRSPAAAGHAQRGRGHLGLVLRREDDRGREVGRALRVPSGLRTGGRTRTPEGAVWSPGSSRAVFLDVDGTTLGTTPVASPAVAAARAEAAAAGLHVFFATGRLPRGLHELQGQLDDDSPAVVHNGAAVVHGGRELRSWPLPTAAAHAFAQWCLDRQHYVECYSSAGMFVSDRRPGAQVTWSEISGPPDGLLPALLASSAEVVKATVDVFEPERLPEVLEAVRKFGLTAELSTAPVLPGVPIVNVTAAGVTKGSAVAWLAEHRGVDLRRALAVGDGHNDVSMFDVVGTSVAMGQAPDAVQAQAHLVAPPVEQDGVALVLQLAARGLL